jgi:hypothetical protein
MTPSPGSACATSETGSPGRARPSSPKRSTRRSGLARRLEDLLARQNGSRLSFPVELGDVAGALGRLEGMPEVEGTRSLWIRGDEVGHLFARSSSTAAHTVVLIVATEQRVSISATKGLDRPGQHAFFTFVRPDPAGLDGLVGEYVTPASRPALLREWAERAICVRVSREAAARWSRRRASRRG